MDMEALLRETRESQARIEGKMDVLLDSFGAPGGLSSRMQGAETAITELKEETITRKHVQFLAIFGGMLGGLVTALGTITGHLTWRQ